MQLDAALEWAHGGLGVGLTLVKQLVELHHGRVDARSPGIGKGSEFTVTLPLLSEAAEDTAVPSMAAEPVLERRRILVVDDNKDTAESLAMLIEMSGHDVRMAYDGLQALEVVDEFRPRVIFLDIGLPKLNGFDTCRRIREQPWGKDMMVVALTGWGQEEDRRKAMEAGFDEHVVKPMDYGKLVKILASLPVGED